MPAGLKLRLWGILLCGLAAGLSADAWGQDGFAVWLEQF